MDKKKRNIKKIQFTSRLKIISLPFILLLDKINLLSYFTPFINYLLKKLKIRKRFSDESNYRKYTRIFKKAFKACEFADSAPIVLFPFMVGSESPTNLKQLMLAKYLQQKKYYPIFIICDKFFSICNREHIGKTRKYRPTFCYECYHNYRYIQKETNISIRYLSEFENIQSLNKYYIEKEKIDKILTLKDCLSYSFEDFPIGKLAFTSILRYFCVGELKGTDTEVKIYKKFLIENMKMAMVFTNIIEEYKKIYKVILWNGALSFDLIIEHICRSRKIGYVTQEAFVGGSANWIYKKNGIAIHLDYKEEWEKFQSERYFSAKEKEKIKSLIDGFRTGKSTVIKYNDEVSKLELSNKERYVGLFSNLNYDTYVLGRNPIFNSINHWIEETISYWNQNVENIKLIVRAHPAEVKMPRFTTDFVENIVRDKITNKIIFFDSTDEVNSYDLFEKIEYGICYASTIGIELALSKIPVIIAGDAFYKQFVICPNNKEEYYNAILRLNAQEYEVKYNSNTLWKYLYFIFCERNLKLQGFNVDYNCGKFTVKKDIQYRELIKVNSDALDKFYQEFSNYE